MTGIFDPAGRYMRLATPRAHRRVRGGIPRRSAAYTSPDAKPPRQLDAMQRRRFEHEARAGRNSVQHDGGDVYAALAASASVELMAQGHTTIDTPRGTLNVAIVQFWRGDAVLEIRTSERSESSRQTRIDRSHLGDVQHVGDQLATQLQSMHRQ